jgi:hypothetical protein
MNEGKMKNAPLANIRTTAQLNRPYTHHTGPVQKMNKGKVVVQFWEQVTSREAHIEILDVPIGSR